MSFSLSCQPWLEEHRRAVKEYFALARLQANEACPAPQKVSDVSAKRRTLTTSYCFLSSPGRAALEEAAETSAHGTRETENQSKRFQKRSAPPAKAPWNDRPAADQSPEHRHITLFRTSMLCISIAVVSPSRASPGRLEGLCELRFSQGPKGLGRPCVFSIPPLYRPIIRHFLRLQFFSDLCLPATPHASSVRRNCRTPPPCSGGSDPFYQALRL